MSVIDEDPCLSYLELGLRLGQHVDGFVDAYFGPEEIADRVGREGPRAPSELVADAARIVADLDGGAGDFDARRRAYLRAQVLGLHTSARKLAGEQVAYQDEVEWSYDVRPEWIDESAFAEAHAALDKVLPGAEPIGDRYRNWRASNTLPRDAIEGIVADLAEDLRERTQRLFGLPDGEHIDWELVTDQPWSGFNYYLGDLQSRVAINIDLPVPSLSIGHLVAHEAYPGHHTEHARKEVGLVRGREFVEETIFCVGTPQCVVAEGLADLGLEIVVPENRWQWLADHLSRHGVDLDPEAAAAVSGATEALGRVRSNVALLLNDRDASQDEAVDYFERWALLANDRARKSVSFLTDPTWRAYIHCYVDGLPLCRGFVDGDPARFKALISEQHTPAQMRS